MAEAPRPRQVEYYNPRGLILGVCFFWGVAMGFLLFYFAPPKALPQPPPPPPPPPVSSRPAGPGRGDGIPIITEVPLAPETQTQRPRLETMDLDPPSPVLTTEGGLTGRTAQPLTPSPARTTTAQPPARRPTQPVMTSPPPIPDLMP